MNKTETICVGAFAGAYGVNGQVRLKSFCAEPAAIADYSPLSDETGARSFEISLSRSINNALIADVTGITSKEAADALKGLRLFARRDQLPTLPDDEFYHTDLIGLTVLDTGGTVLGKVKAVQNHGASDLLEIIPENGSDTVLLPFTNQAVPTVDLSGGRIIADPPAGVF
ncbi:MAG: 16S rRNA processing protein RimM [Rhodobacterales bacterium]|nr:MAG: 16S rRNA processing protein RimM [Rhodobacterales bacterium]